MQWVIFILIVLGILLLGHWYLGKRLIAPRRWSRRARRAAWLGLGLLVLLPFVANFGRFSNTLEGGVSFAAWLGYTAFGLSSLLFAATVASEPLRIWLDRRRRAVEAAADKGRVLSRRRWLRASLDGAAVTAAILGTAKGAWASRRPPEVRPVEVPIAGLPPAWDGLRILQLSDIHVGLTIGRAYVEQIVAAAERLPADLIVFTGDLVDGTVRALAPHVAPLGRLSAPLGKFLVTGNHEYYSGVGPWLRHVRTLGFEPLVNEHRVLERDGARLVLAGVTDHTAGRLLPAHRPDPAAAVAGAPTDVPRILLAHQPVQIHAAAEVGFDLQLSGHTHGGQYWPWQLFVPFAQPYTEGLHRHGDMWIYVNRGTGYWGPPLRLGIPAELSWIRLRSA